MGFWNRPMKRRRLPLKRVIPPAAFLAGCGLLARAFDPDVAQLFVAAMIGLAYIFRKQKSESPPSGT
jgi:hypothetical protein